MNIIRTKKAYKAICSLAVHMGATLQSSGNVTNPESVQCPNPLGDPGTGETVCSLPYSFEEYSENETEISISFKGITSIDSNIKRLLKLEKLDLRSNDIEILPAEIGELENLQCLNLNSNKLETLPAVIWELKNLQELLLSDNNIDTLPPKIVNLKNLQYLDLNNNKLTTLPVEIGSLKNLRVLYLSYNRLETLPVEISKLSKSLELLDLTGNNISEEGEREKTLGKKELRAIFEDRVEFNGDVL
ncbi:uncharacterized protein VICG_00857 [Vittaforma corneae ATCC 50505]|uniref:Leucine-rich repeat domain-containing protein n=1 Tax=Vittaforma corneae (strain ATCC 50505) TaxID=993615 RepID=L2GNM5_VITCO|nr:uncharacterized protein VICG_00857 [Vittaforma corneae ATCC 50505]ELA42214.1 hypothetical protein VICG_00857 [Vittaforma corneae ATCC 50505]